VPGEVSRFHLFLSGRRKVGEEVFLTGLATDKYRNFVDKHWKIDIFLQIESPGHKEVKEITGFLTRKYQFCLPLEGLKEGVHRVKAIERKTGKVVAVSNPIEILPKDSNALNIYWGDIHGHGEMSDGVGNFENMYQKAEEVGLDFAAGGDHACYFTDNQWEWMQDVVNSFYKPGIFCTLIGYEWAGAQGHRNIYTSKNRIKLFRGMYGPERNFNVVNEEFKGSEDYVAGPHTKSAGIHLKFGTTSFWKDRDPELIRYYEIYSISGNYDEYANIALNEGAIMGFTSGGDYHGGLCFFSPEVLGRQGKISPPTSKSDTYKSGITGCFAEKLDRKSIIKGIRNRKTYATTGAKMIIDFKISGIMMGDIGKGISKPLLKANIHGCDTIVKINVIRNGQTIHSQNCNFLDGTFEFEDKEPEDKNWYYMKIYQADGEMAWTSPIWVEVKK
jgi:hypothetical protein